MSTGCPDCRSGLDHCHGAIIRHSRQRSECTEDGCTSPEHLPHALHIDCDSIDCGCGATEAAAPAARRLG